MPDHEMPEYGEIADQLLLLQLGTDAAELHGSLCGYLSGGAEAPGRALWLGRVMADPDPPQLEPESALDRLYQAS